MATKNYFFVSKFFCFLLFEATSTTFSVGITVPSYFCLIIDCLNLELQLFKKSSKYWTSLNWNWKLKTWAKMAINDFKLGIKVVRYRHLPADVGWGSTTDIMHGCQTGHVSHHPLHPTYRVHVLLKVPKCEIFNILDSDDFCTIKPLWVDDFGAKYKLIILIFGWNRHHLFSYVHAELSLKFLMSMLSISLSSFCVHSA
jgi:hypothetical protein